MPLKENITATWFPMYSGKLSIEKFSLVWVKWVKGLVLHNIAIWNGDFHQLNANTNRNKFVFSSNTVQKKRTDEVFLHGW